MVEIKTPRKEKAGLIEGRQLNQELGETADHHADRDRQNRLIEQRGEQKRRADDRDIEHHGRKGGRGEAPNRVQHAHRYRRETDKQQIGKHDPQQFENEPCLV